MAYSVSELNGVKIYNLSAGKTQLQFLEEAYKNKISLKYNEDYKNVSQQVLNCDSSSGSRAMVCI